MLQITGLQFLIIKRTSFNMIQVRLSEETKEQVFIKIIYKCILLLFWQYLQFTFKFIQSQSDVFKTYSKHLNLTNNLTDQSEGERSVPQISSKIARSVRALGYVELDYVCRFLFSLEALKQVFCSNRFHLSKGDFFRVTKCLWPKFN